MFLKQELAFFALILLAAVGISLFAYCTFYNSPLELFVRLLALNGFIAVAIAAIMTPFLKEITLFFKKPFTKVHHYFAATGLMLLTLHPIFVVILTMNPAIVLPNLSSPYFFFLYGGVVALISIYIALGAVLLRRKMVKYWRYFHMLMYLALFFGVVHGTLIGPDFQSIPFIVIYVALFGAAVFAFALKRWQFHQIRAKMKNHAQKPTQQ
jgi:methionine sulfoxide reductase heme-binding subunit